MSAPLLALAGAATEAQLRAHADAFDALAEKGALAPAALPRALELAGYAGVDDALLRACAAPQDTLDYHEFLRVAAAVAAAVNTRAGMVAAFRAFDREGRGFVTAHACRNIFERLGPPGSRLHADTADSLLQLADPSDSGRVDYEALVEAVFGQHERLLQRRAVERSAAAAAAAGGKKGAAAAAKPKPKK
jgi:Ca2+-binding EF-hand superfamily protein